MKKVILVAIILFSFWSSLAQVKIGDNPTALNSSSVLELESSDKAFLAPRMTTALKEAIATPADGMVVYDTDKFCYSLYSNGEWTCLGQDVSAVVGSILTLDCGNAIINGQPYSNQTVTGVNFIVGYSGSNGGAYDAQSFASTGVIGLTAKILPGNFNKTNGSVTYYVTGTPTSAGTATFAINLGGQACTVSIPVIESSGLATLNCASSTLVGTLSPAVTATTQTITLPYSNGNGGPYSDKTFTTSDTNLNLYLQGGSFATGSGTLTLKVVGTPTASGSVTSSISLGGSSCIVTFLVSALVPCTPAPTAVASAHTPATFVSAANADIGGTGHASFTASGGSYTTLSWSLTSIPATGVLQGAVSGTGTSAPIDLVPGARGRVFITWTASRTGACLTTSATSTDSIVIGDIILYSLTLTGCTSCAAYEEASDNSWVQIPNTDYYGLAANVTNATVVGMPGIQPLASQQGEYHQLVLVSEPELHILVVRRWVIHLSHHQL